VWTGDERLFFYNPSSKQSVWELPEELKGRADVAKMIQTVPDVTGEFSSREMYIYIKN